MSDWQMGQHDKAREDYDRAVNAMEKGKSWMTDAEQVRRFQMEAAELIGMNKLPAPDTKKDAKPAK